MHKLLMIAAVAALAACSKEAAPPAADANVAAANMADVDANANMADANMAAPVALASLNETTWEFTDAKSGKAVQESVDAAGKYIAVSGKEHFDHGTAVMKDGKACFTSAMDKEGELCWTDPMVAIGSSGESTAGGRGACPAAPADAGPQVDRGAGAGARGAVVLGGYPPTGAGLVTCADGASAFLDPGVSGGWLAFGAAD